MDSCPLRVAELAWSSNRVGLVGERHMVRWWCFCRHSGDLLVNSSSAHGQAMHIVSSIVFYSLFRVFCVVRW